MPPAPNFKEVGSKLGGDTALGFVLFVRLIGLCLFGFVDFLFLLGSGKGCVCDCGTPWTFLLPFFVRLAFHQFVCPYVTRLIYLISFKQRMLGIFNFIYALLMNN